MISFPDDSDRISSQKDNSMQFRDYVKSNEE